MIDGKRFGYFPPAPAAFTALRDLAITHAGLSNPMGEFTLESNHGNVNVRGGQGMLLRVETLSSSATRPS